VSKGLPALKWGAFHADDTPLGQAVCFNASPEALYERSGDLIGTRLHWPGTIFGVRTPYQARGIIRFVEDIISRRPRS